MLKRRWCPISNGIGQMHTVHQGCTHLTLYGTPISYVGVVIRTTIIEYCHKGQAIQCNSIRTSHLVRTEKNHTYPADGPWAFYEDNACEQVVNRTLIQGLLGHHEGGVVFVISCATATFATTILAVSTISKSYIHLRKIFARKARSLCLPHDVIAF